VDANLPCPAGCPCDLLRLVHGAHRLGGSLVMILLSCRGWPPAAIAELLGCDPATVRRWIHRYNQHGVTGLADRPSWPSAAGQPPARRAHPSAGPARRLDIARLWQRLGRPAMSSPTLYRRVREVACWRRPRLVAKGDPDREGVLGNLNQAIGELPAGAVVLAEDETHVNLLPWVRATWIAHGTRQQVMTPGTNRRRTIFGAVGGLGGRFLYQIASKGAQRRLHRVPGAASGRLPSGTRGGGGLRQRDHPPRQARPALAGDPSQGGGVARGPLQPHDNPVERIWAALKAWLANSPTSTIQGRLRQVHAFFRQRSPAQLLATAAPSSSPWLPEGYIQNFPEAALEERASAPARSLTGSAALAPKTPPPSPMWSIPPYLQRSKPPGGRQ
jgi:hypothetical protein